VNKHRLHAWCRAYFIGLCTRLYDVALFHLLIQNLDCWLSTTKKFSSHHTLFLVSSGVWAWDYAKCRSEAMTSVLSLQTLDHPPHLPRLIEFKEHQLWKVISTSLNGPVMGVNTHSLSALPAEVSEQGQGKRALCVPSVWTGRLPWVDGNFLPPLLRMTHVRTCDLAKCRREAVTCMFLLQKLDHSPHLPRWPVPQTEFKEHQYCKVFYLISRCIFGQDSALPLFVFTFCRSVWTHTPCPLWWGWDEDCSGCRERIYPYHWDRPR